MKNLATQRSSPGRRPPMVPAAQALLDDARARVIAAGGPSLDALRQKLAGWDCPEVSGNLQKARK